MKKKRLLIVIAITVVKITFLSIYASVAAQAQSPQPPQLRALQWWAASVPYREIFSTIAIVGSGVSPELDPTGRLKDSLIGGWDVTKNVADYSDVNPAFHDSKMAGIIAGGYQGIAPRARILAVRASRVSPEGKEIRQITDYANGIRYAADSQAQIILCAWDTTPSDEIAAAVEYASQHGSIVVASMGNDGVNKDLTPGCWNVASRLILRVTASLRDGTRARNCAYSQQYADVAAPADDYLMLGSTETSFEWSTPGTSCAATFVATLAAMLRDALSPEQVIATICGTVDVNSDLFTTTWTGGVVNFQRALNNDLNVPRDAVSFKGKTKKMNKKLSLSGTEVLLGQQSGQPILRIWLQNSLLGFVFPEQDKSFSFVAKGRFSSGAEVRVQSSLGGEMTWNIP